MKCESSRGVELRADESRETGVSNALSLEEERGKVAWCIGVRVYSGKCVPVRVLFLTLSPLLVLSFFILRTTSTFALLYPVVITPTSL